MAKRLVTRGFEVTWLSSRFPDSKSEESLAGVQIVRVGSDITTFLHGTMKLAGEYRDALVLESLSAIPYLTPLFSRHRTLSVMYHVVPYDAVVRKVGLLSPIVIGLQNIVTPILYKRQRIITISFSTQRELLARGYSNVRMVRVGADPPSVEVSIEGKENLVVFTGPLKPWKRVEHCLAAFSMLPSNWRLAVIGAPDSEAYSRQLLLRASELQISARTSFTGRISESSKNELYRKARVAIVTSEKEGWGLCAMEPQIYGCPVVGYDVPGIRDSVRDGESGILVESGNVPALTQALLSLVEDAERWRRLATTASSLYRDYTWDNVFDDFYGALASEI
ncbi:MAG: glycosyltransferase family 4 protein [Thermoplasmata archaeon]